MKKLSSQDQLKAYRRRLKAQSQTIDNLKRELDEVVRDRTKLREHFADRYKWWWKLLKDNQSPSVLWLAEQDANLLRTLKWWPI